MSDVGLRQVCNIRDHATVNEMDIVSLEGKKKTNNEAFIFIS
jgi:hypothetical protein